MMELGSQNEFKNIEFGEKHDFTKVKPMFLFFVSCFCVPFVAPEIAAGQAHGRKNIAKNAGKNRT